MATSFKQAMLNVGLVRPSRVPAVTRETAHAIQVHHSLEDLVHQQKQIAKGIYCNSCGSVQHYDRICPFKK